MQGAHESFIKLLEISTLDDLNDKIIKLIIMVLIVSYFQRVPELQITTGMDMRFMAVSIAALCIGVYFLHRQKL